MSNFISDKTIAAISTAQGEGGIGVIRISGEQAVAIGDKVFCGVNGKKLSSMKGYTAAFGKIVNQDNKEVDEAVALVFKAPHSYTGEDVVELSCHGGVFITQQFCGLSLKPVQSRLSSEFTKRACFKRKN